MSGRMRRIAERLYPPPLFLNTGSRLEVFLARWAKPARVVEVGAGNRRYRPDVVNLDMKPDPAVDLVCSAERLALRSDSIDAVFSTAVLEHVENDQDMVKEIHRIVRPDGEVYVEIPFLSRYHECPADYRRLTLPGLRHLFGSFEEVESGVCVGPASALAEMTQEFLASFTDHATAKKTIRFVAGWLLQPVKLLDLVLARKKTAHLSAYGVYFWGRKKREESRKSC